MAVVDSMEVEVADRDVNQVCSRLSGLTKPVQVPVGILSTQNATCQELPSEILSGPSGVLQAAEQGFGGIGKVAEHPNVNLIDEQPVGCV